MSYGEIGFLLGALPGVGLILRNMWQGRSLQKRVEAVAWKDHDWNDTQLSHEQQLRLMTNPQRYIDSDDSPEMVEAKKQLIAALPAFWWRHWTGGAVVFAGAITGTVIGNSIG